MVRKVRLIFLTFAIFDAILRSGQYNSVEYKYSGILERYIWSKIQTTIIRNKMYQFIEHMGGFQSLLLPR